jgi:N-methylhydantoinase A
VPEQDLYVGVDIGGTFTDLVLMDRDGTVGTSKAPTTPGRLEQGVLDALQVHAQSMRSDVNELLPRVAWFGHGTTQATNAMIERKGSATGLITTQGFGDTILIQRLMGYTAGVPSRQLGHYSQHRYPDPIVPRRLIREVPERVDKFGRVVTPLDEAAVRAAVSDVLSAGAGALAVTLLWSFRNPAHEQRIREIALELDPDLDVAISSEVAPLIGEYERTATTVLNSYLAATVGQYLERLEASLRDQGFAGTFGVLDSIGGVVSSEHAARHAVTLLTSGPTGGVIGSVFLAEALGHRNVITTDMGGTSFDVGLIIDGKPLVSAVSEVEKYHVATPMVDIRAIGAGGGSIASVTDGLLSVGPESAGARPGPVAYGRGGELPTVTDADLVLGIIDPESFLGGRMKLDTAGAAEAIRRHIAEPLGIEVEDAAAGIRQVADSQMADLLRELTVGRGRDPRDFVLYAYGGAGPMHCAGYGAELGVSQIVVPATSMAQSAYGAMASDVHISAERSPMLRGGTCPAEPWEGVDPREVQRTFDELEEECLTGLDRSGIEHTAPEITRIADIRYRQQVHSLMVPVPNGPIDETAIQTLIERFETMYEDTYGRGSGSRGAGVEIPALRVSAIGRTAKPRLTQLQNGHAAPPPVSRRIYEPTLRQEMQAQVVHWDAMPRAFRVSGPAIVEHPTTTVYVGPTQRAELDAHGNLIVTTKEAS